MEHLSQTDHLNSATLLNLVNKPNEEVEGGSLVD